jgi:hypothetical protein
MITMEDVAALTGADIASRDSLFADAIEQDGWIHYHATSSLSEKHIDTSGFEWTDTMYTAQDVRDIVGIFDSINWYDADPGGYPVLSQYSLAYDFTDQDRKPTFFRETPKRSLLYATKEFAGGETARGIRIALRNLSDYLANESLRLAHYETSRARAISQVERGEVPDRVIKVNLDWLQHSVEGLANLRTRCDDCEQRYKYGVIYAVRFAKGDFPFLHWCGTNGLRCFKPLPRERIVAKARLTDFSDDGSPQTTVFPEDGEMVSLLLAAEAEGRAYTPTEHNVSQLRKRRDPSAGLDESEEIAHRYGSALLASAVRESRKACL